MSQPGGPGADFSPDQGEQDDVDLAEELAALGEQVGDLETLIRTLARGVQAELDGPRRQLADLTARVEALEPPAPTPPSSDPAPTAWVDRAGGEDWGQLAQWVDWLGTTYDVLTSRAVMTCWPAHRGVTEELAALRSAWTSAAAAAADDAATDALIYWHDRWLHPTLMRLRESYQQRNCQEWHKPSGAPRATDPDLLAEAMDESIATTTGELDPAGQDHGEGDDPPPVDPRTGELL